MADAPGFAAASSRSAASAEHHPRCKEHEGGPVRGICFHLSQPLCDAQVPHAYGKCIVSNDLSGLPNAVIVTTRDKKDYIRVLLCSYNIHLYRVGRSSWAVMMCKVHALLAVGSFPVAMTTRSRPESYAPAGLLLRNLKLSYHNGYI